jgi:hypothetical protein
MNVPVMGRSSTFLAGLLLDLAMLGNPTCLIVIDTGEDDDRVED